MTQPGNLPIRLFQEARYSNGLTAESAWLGIYQVLLWHEPRSGLPHIIDANNLRVPRGSRSRTSGTAWVERARDFQAYLATHLQCQAEQVPEYLDRLMMHPEYQGMQRQNPLGSAFPDLLEYILEQFGNQGVHYEREVLATKAFPGISIPGRSAAPKIDILVKAEGRPRAIISAKWSLRHDRLNDISNECPVYKAAAYVTRSEIDYIVVTNEFQPARLLKLLSDHCVDTLVHLHKPAVVQVCGLDGRLGELADLTALIQRTHTWA